MNNDEKFIFFWGGPFSQWYPCSFTIRDNETWENVTYNCAEQYMMAMKARVFKDEESYKLIMNSSTPREQKALGRKIKNFDPLIWESYAKAIVTKGNIAKFMQDPDLKEYLLLTEGKELVEASPYDKVWGIGLSENDPRRFDKSKWQGKNWLGECLMDVRTYIKNYDNWIG